MPTRSLNQLIVAQRHLACLCSFLCSLLCGLLFSSNGIASSDKATFLPMVFNVNGYALLADLQENTQLLEKIITDIPANGQTHYKGAFSGYPDSAIRVSEINGHWRGIVLFENQLYQINASYNANAASSSGLLASRPDWPSEETRLCASPTDHNDSAMHSIDAPSTSTSAIMPAVELNVTTAMSNNLVTSVATLADVCINPIDGVCLLPEIEFAYDLSYQNLPSAETPLQRAVREINEMEMFFMSGMGFQFSRLSLTMLDATQDSLIGSSDDPDTLLNRLRILRGSNQLGYLQNPRSIFHFVTGRDFPTVPGPDGGNIIGIAYLNQVCASFGQNTGLTDAGDTSLVSLVMAHEIGHNMGAGHDTTSGNGCPSNQNVMSPSLGVFAAGFSAFSSCSISEINQSVAAALSTSCFDFPVDVGINADSNNPLSPNRVDPFDLVYSINADDGYISISSVQIDGVIPNNAEGNFINAMVSGGSCSVTSSTYRCTVDDPSASMQLTITASVDANADEFTVQHTVQASGSHITDVRVFNNTITDVLNNFGAASGDPAPEIGPGDGSSANSADNSSGGSSGGGGAVSPLSLLLMLVSALIGHRRF